MAEENGKQFSIVDALDINTVVYLVNENENETPKFTIQKLDYEEEIKGKIKEKTFFVEGPIKDKQNIVVLSFEKDKVVMNNGTLEPDKIKISKKTTDFKYTPVCKEVSIEYKDIEFTHDLKRSVSIIDPITGDELKPEIYLDEESNTLKGKYNLNPFKQYFAFEIPNDYSNQ